MERLSFDLEPDKMPNNKEAPAFRPGLQEACKKVLRYEPAALGKLAGSRLSHNGGWRATLN